MTPYLLVGLGGACGSLVRFVIGKEIAKRTQRTFPVSTLLINVTGAFLLGFIANLRIGSGWLLLLTDGFLGAYTTFSTFMFEGFSIVYDKKVYNAVIYIGGTLITGLVAYLLGMFAAYFLH